MMLFYLVPSFSVFFSLVNLIFFFLSWTSELYDNRARGPEKYVKNYTPKYLGCVKRSMYVWY